MADISARSWLLLSVTYLAYVCIYCARKPFAVAKTSRCIKDDLGVADGQLGLIDTVLLATYAVGQLSLAHAVRRFGRRWTLVLAFALSGAATAAFGLCSSAPAMMAAWGAAGLFAAPASPLFSTLVGEAVPSRDSCEPWSCANLKQNTFLRVIECGPQFRNLLPDFAHCAALDQSSRGRPEPTSVWAQGLPRALVVINPEKSLYDDIGYILKPPVARREQSGCALGSFAFDACARRTGTKCTFRDGDTSAHANALVAWRRQLCAGKQASPRLLENAVCSNNSTNCCYSRLDPALRVQQAFVNLTLRENACVRGYRLNNQVNRVWGEEDILGVFFRRRPREERARRFTTDPQLLDMALQASCLLGRSLPVVNLTGNGCEVLTADAVQVHGCRSRAECDVLRTHSHRLG